MSPMCEVTEVAVETLVVPPKESLGFIGFQAGDRTKWRALAARGCPWVAMGLPWLSVLPARFDVFLSAAAMYEVCKGRDMGATAA
jgi:hypothetical protein